MKNLSLVFALVMLSLPLAAEEEHATYVETPYQSPKAVFDIFLDRPDKVGSALYWIRSFTNPLTESPYNMSMDFMDIVVILHGTEIVTVARKNYEKYRDVVERMRYYAEFGIKFKVCGLAAKDYDYSVKDFQAFIEVVPSAITELAHWQQQGYALITPKVMIRHQ